MKNRKYSYLSGRGSEIPMIFQAFKLAKEDRILPKFDTSFVFEFYQREAELSSDFNRSNFYMRILLDDKPLAIPWADCDSNQHCSWDSIQVYMKSRIVPSDEV